MTSYSSIADPPRSRLGPESNMVNSEWRMANGGPAVRTIRTGFPTIRHSLLAIRRDRREQHAKATQPDRDDTGGAGGVPARGAHATGSERRAARLPAPGGDVVRADRRQ